MYNRNSVELVQNPSSLEMHSNTQDRISDSYIVVKNEPRRNAPNPVEPLQQTSVSERPSTERVLSSPQVSESDKSEGQTGPIELPSTDIETPLRQGRSRDESEGQIGSSGSRGKSISRKQGNSTTSPTIIKSPDWLPKGWITEMKSRGSGTTAGTRDKYYIEPNSGHRFRSKPEVLWFLDTGQISRPKSKSKLPGSDCTGNSEVQPLTLRSVPPPNLHKHDVAVAIGGATDQLETEPNYVSNAKYTQNDRDGSSSCRQTGDSSISLVDGVYQSPKALQTASPLAERGTTVQDALSEQFSKSKSGNYGRKSNIQGKQQYPGSDGEKQERAKECPNHVSVHQNINKVCNLDDSGNSSKKQRMANPLTETTESNTIPDLNEKLDDAIDMPSKEGFPFPSSGTQPINQGNDLGISGKSAKKQDGHQDSSEVHFAAAVSNEGPENAIHKPFKASFPASQSKSTGHSLPSPVISQSGEFSSVVGNLNFYSQSPCPVTPLLYGLANPVYCSTNSGSTTVFPITYPWSPSSVLMQHNSSKLQVKRHSKTRPNTNKLVKLKPQEMKRQLVSLGRKLCKQSMGIAQASPPPKKLDSQTL